jgi:hypothetical protein
MSENKHHYTSNELNLTQASRYNLLLQIDANGFNYAVIAGQQLLAWGENYSLDELRDPKQLRDILTANYRQVTTGLHSTGFTLLPTSLFDGDHIADVARLLDVHKNEKVNAEALDSQNMLIYKVDAIATYAIKDLDNQKTIYAEAGWLKAIATDYPLSNNLYLNIGNDVVSVLNYTNSKLRFYNTFTFKNHEELAYFCALVTTELQINPQDTKLLISGDINNTDRYFTYLKDFFGNVELNNIRLLTLPAEVSSHKILSLSALSLCASSEED